MFAYWPVRADTIEILICIYSIVLSLVGNLIILRVVVCHLEQSCVHVHNALLVTCVFKE